MVTVKVSRKCILSAIEADDAFNPLTHCCDMGRPTAIKHHVPDRVKPLFVMFDIQAL